MRTLQQGIKRCEHHPTPWQGFIEIERAVGTANAVRNGHMVDWQRIDTGGHRSDSIFICREHKYQVTLGQWWQRNATQRHGKQCYNSAEYSLNRNHHVTPLL